MKIEFVLGALALIVTVVIGILAWIRSVQQDKIQKRQQDFTEQVHKESKKPKNSLYHLNVNNTKSAPKKWRDE